jgi:hypothetical protein
MSLLGNSKNTAELKTQNVTYVKQFIVYDGNLRPIEVYTAQTDAADGHNCSKVTYEYVSPSSSKVLKMKEENAPWDATWDI